MSDYYPEGGFYEKQAKQGEDPWADDAQFDPPAPTSTEDMRADDSARTTNVSWGDLTKAASYEQGPSQPWGC